MTLQSAVEAALPELRAEAEARMTLALAAFSPNGSTTDDDGYKVPAFAPEGHTIGRAQGGTQATSDAATRYLRIGDTERPVLAGGLHIPIAAPVPIAGEQRGQGWEYVVTEIGASDDPALLGRRYLVVGVPAKSHATARRLDVVEI